MTEEKVYDLNERLARIEGCLEELKKEVEYIRDHMVSPKDLLKYMIYVLIIVLSFVSAVLGVNWVFKYPLG